MESRFKNRAKPEAGFHLRKKKKPCFFIAKVTIRF